MSILRALYDYQAWADSQSGTAKPGCSMIDLAFAVQIDEAGNFKALVDLRKDKKHGTPYLLPALVGRSGKNAWQTVNVGWDYREYVIGIGKVDEAEQQKSDMCELKLGSFRQSIADLCDQLSGEAAKQAVAIRAFYCNPENLILLKNDPLFPECALFGKCCMTFLVGGSDIPFAALPGVLEYVGRKRGESADSDAPSARCLITGESAPYALLHPYTPIQGSQAIAKLASWQINSGYDSYGHTKGENAPVSVKAAEMYGRAFDRLRKLPDNALFLGVDTCLFWTLPQDQEFEYIVSLVLRAATKDRETLKVALHAFVQSAKEGHYSDDKRSFNLYVLSPNRARIAERCECEITIAEAADRLVSHLTDCAVADSSGVPIYWPLNHLFLTLTLDGKLSSLPRARYGSYIDSIFSRTLYPTSLYQAILRCVRENRTVSGIIAGALKGYLLREQLSNKGACKYTMSLNESIAEPGYLIGRVLALIEKSVNDTSPSLASLFGPKHFSDTMTKPGLVVPQLLRLYQPNLAATPYLQRQIAEIMDAMEHLPTRLLVGEQGSFVLGYYQQKQALYRKRRDLAEPDDLQDIVMEESSVAGKETVKPLHTAEQGVS